MGSWIDLARIIGWFNFRRIPTWQPTRSGESKTIVSVVFIGSGMAGTLCRNGPEYQNNWSGATVIRRKYLGGKR